MYTTWDGGRSSAVERLPVEQDVGGSNPLGHPRKKRMGNDTHEHLDMPEPAIEPLSVSENEAAQVPAELSPHIKRLLNRYINGLKSQSTGFTPIHVDEIASKVAKFYELVRKVVDWKEDNVLRRAAIERILKRLLFAKMSGLSNSYRAELGTIAETLTLDLIRGGHLPNDEIPRERIADIETALKKYVYFMQHAIPSSSDPIVIKNRINFQTFIIELAACEIEDILKQPILVNSLIMAMTESMIERIRVVPKDALTADEIQVQTYIAVCRTLFDLDDAFIVYHLLAMQYTEWTKPTEEFITQMNSQIISIWEQSDSILKHPAAKQFYRICESWDTVYALIGDVMDAYADKPERLRSIFSDKRKFEAEIALNYDKRYKTLKKRLFTLAIFSTLSVFASNWFTFFVVEVPMANIFAEGFNLFNAFMDFLIPSVVMFFLVVIIRPPKPENKERVMQTIRDFVYADSRLNYYEVRIKGPRRPIIGFFIYTIYLTITVAAFWFVGWIFYVATLPITSVIFDTITIALTVFASVTIRNKSKELDVGERTGATEFVMDMLSVPMAKIGSYLAAKWKEYNVIAFLFTFLVETPVAVLIDIIEQWSQFIKDRRAELS